MMQRISIPPRGPEPGRIEFVDLGPGVASGSGVHGTFAVPARHILQQRAHNKLDLTPEQMAERKKAQERAWRAANRDRIRETDREAARKRRERQKRYWETHREEALQRSAAYWDQKREEINARKRARRAVLRAEREVRGES